MEQPQGSQDAEAKEGGEQPSSAKERKPNEQSEYGGERNRSDEKAQKPSKLKQLWAKSGLDVPTILLMLKAAVPQTIAIAMYRADAVASQYTTLGFLVAIMAVLGMCVLPRGKFIQTMFLNIVMVCLAAAINTLALWSAVQARKHNTPVGSTALYNSSQSAVCGVWLFAQTYFFHSIRSARPQLQFPVILYSVLTCIFLTFGALFSDMASVRGFTVRLLEATLTGFGLATGVSLFIVPFPQRKIVFKEIAGYIQSLRGLINAQMKYTASLEHIDMFQGVQPDSSDSDSKAKHSSNELRGETPEEKSVTSALSRLRTLHSKLTADMVFACREFAYGKLGPTEIEEIQKLLRGIFLPMIGLPTLIDVFKRTAHRRGWDKPSAELNKNEQKAVEEWQDIMKLLHEPFNEIGTAMDKAFEHVLLRLELAALPKGAKNGSDEEAQAGSDPKPGSDRFTAWFQHKTDQFYESRQVTLQEWCERKGISTFSEEDNAEWMEKAQWDLKDGGSRDQRELFVLLFVEYLLHASSQHTLKLVKYADSKVADGTMSKSRVIIPAYSRLKKWLLGVLSSAEEANEDSYEHSVDGLQEVFLGEAFRARKDPEHLPPRNAFERIGNKIRVIPRLLGSKHSVFGMRVASATLTIGIIAYLAETQLFFIRQRLVWAMIIATISMTRTSGQSLFNFLLRAVGTLGAMVASLLIYYIPDKHVAGVIVFMFLWEAACFYIVLKKPQYTVVGILAAVTVILIIGYELQVRKIGVQLATTNGQPAYNIYLLAPYRLATVVGGLFVSWIWTIFPFPVTEHSELRKELGASLYLAANFYAIVHERIAARVRGEQGDPHDTSSPAYKLEEMAHKVFFKELLLLDRIKTYASFTGFELMLGGRFPKQKYQDIIQLIENVMNYTALMSYASRSLDAYEDDNGERSGREWQQDFKSLIAKVALTSHDITTRLCLLSSAVAEGRPLPPYLADLQPFRLAQRLQEIDKDILSVRHIAEPGYAAFAVTQISSRSVVADLNALTNHVKDLVGELDFSFHVVSTSSSTSTSSVDVSSYKGKRE